MPNEAQVTANVKDEGGSKSHDGDKLKARANFGDAYRKVDPSVVFTKLNWRLLPLFFLMVVFNYIDRTNLAFAAIQLNHDLGFDSQVYGLGSGLFFTTYATLQIPSNILLRRFGGPTWLAAIVAAWGMCAVSFAFITTKGQFYALRTLLGVAEAGAFPGMWYMMSKFYPPARITVAYAVVESGISLSNVVAGPLAAALLSLDATMGYRGWQWLFMLEGLPSIMLAFALIKFLPPSPEQATELLTSDERKYLSQVMADVERKGQLHSKTSDAQEAASLLPVTADASGSTQSAVATQHRSTSTSSSSMPAMSASLAQIAVPDDDQEAVVTSSMLRVSNMKQQPHSRNGNDNSSSSSITELTSPSKSKSGGGVHALLEKWMGSETYTSLAAAVKNPCVWYMGCAKLVKDIASYGILFFAPMIVQALIKGGALQVPGTKVPKLHKVDFSKTDKSEATGGSKFKYGKDTGGTGRLLMEGMTHSWDAVMSHYEDASTCGFSSMATAVASVCDSTVSMFAQVAGLDTSLTSTTPGPLPSITSNAAHVLISGGNALSESLQGSTLEHVSGQSEQGVSLLSSSVRSLLGAVVPIGEGEAGVKAALLTSVPFGLAAMATLYVAHRSQATGERVRHMSIPPMISGACLLLIPTVVQHSTVAAFILLCAAVVGVHCGAAPQLSLLSELAAGPGLVVALPMYNSLGNLGGFLGPSIIGILLAQTSSFSLPMSMMGTCLATAGVALFSMTRLLKLNVK